MFFRIFFQGAELILSTFYSNHFRGDETYRSSLQPVSVKHFFPSAVMSMLIPITLVISPISKQICSCWGKLKCTLPNNLFCRLLWAYPNIWTARIFFSCCEFSSVVFLKKLTTEYWWYRTSHFLLICCMWQSLLHMAGLSQKQSSFKIQPFFDQVIQYTAWI